MIFCILENPLSRNSGTDIDLFFVFGVEVVTDLHFTTEGKMTVEVEPELGFCEQDHFFTSLPGSPVFIFCPYIDKTG